MRDARTDKRQKTYNVALFEEELGEVGTILAGCLLPISGSLVDRFGARVMMPAAGVLLGLACTWMAQLESLTSLYLGFLMLRCFG